MSIPFSLPKALKSLVIVLISAVVIIFIINSSVFDEELLPEISAMLKPKPTLSEEKNIYYALMGLEAADGKDMVSAGVQLIRRYRDNRDNRKLDDITSQDYAEILGDSKLDEHWKSQYTRCNSRIEDKCFDKLIQQLKNKPITDQRLIKMLARYKTIQEMPRYQDIQDSTFATPLPSYSTILILSQLHATNSYLTKPVDNFLKDLHQDLKFWRKILAQSSTLIGQMVAVAAIRNDLEYLSALIANQQLSAEQIILIEKILTPISHQEHNIAAAFQGEQVAMHYYLQNFKVDEIAEAYGLSSALMPWFVQSNATSNTYFKYFTQPLIELSQHATPDFTQALKEYLKYNNANEKINSLTSFSPSSLYNLGGKFFVKAAAGEAFYYIGRIHDLNGIYGLISVQLQLKQSDVEKAEIIIENSPHKNPVTGLPFEFDPKQNRLWFSCFDKPSKCRVFLS